MVSVERVWILYVCSVLMVFGDSYWLMLLLIWGFGVGSVGKSWIVCLMVFVCFCCFLGVCWNMLVRFGWWWLLVKMMSWWWICFSIFCVD